MSETVQSFDEPVRSFDRLLASLENALQPSDRSPDAIDRILDAAPRTTQVCSLRDDPLVERFRDDLTHGLIRLDTADAVFQLVTRLLERYTGA